MINPDALEAGPYLDGKPWWATIRGHRFPARFKNSTILKVMSIGRAEAGPYPDARMDQTMCR
jgi:hypothetical protein